MAKDLSRLMNAREHMVINPNTSGNSEHVSEFMKLSGWTGEIFVQLKDGDASLWTLAQDNETAIEFISKNQIEYLTDLQISAITPSETNVKEEYALVDHDGEIMGDTIKIYKDSALYQVYLGHVDDALISEDGPEHTTGTGNTALCFIYILNSGKYNLTAIDIEEFLEESEFADGLQVDNHVVSVKIDEDSERFLTVSPDGVKLSGIQEELDKKVDKLIEGPNGRALIFNEADGGGAKFEHNDGTWSFAGVNDGGANGIAGQIYAVARNDDGKMKGTRIDVTKDAMYYTVGDASASERMVPENEIAVKGDVIEIDNKLEELSAATIEFSAATVERLDQISGDVTTLSAETILFSAATIENERVVSEALNDLNDRLNKIATPQDILTSEDYGEGFADAFDVKDFSVYDVDTTDSATTSGVRTVVVDGLKKMDFSRLSIDCGTF